MSETDREVLFARTLEEVKRTAREQGNSITKEQVREAFVPLGFDGEQLKMVLDYLKKQNIGIGEAPDPEENLTKKDRAYLEIYLDQIGGLPSASQGERAAVILSAMAGELEAQRRLMELFLPDVVEIARLYAGQGVFLEDLIGEGNVALAMGVGMLGAMEGAMEAQGMLARMIMDAMEDHIQENAAAARIARKVEAKVDRAFRGSAAEGDAPGACRGIGTVPGGDSGRHAHQRLPHRVHRRSPGWLSSSMRITNM